MNLKQIAVAGLACCAIAVSCQGNDKKISYEDAEKYVKEHCTLTEAPKAKSGKLEWNFNNTDENTAKGAYESIKNMMKNPKDYTVSGSGELADSYLESDIVLNEKTLVTFKENDIYQNSTGIKIAHEYTSSGIKNKDQIQFDDKGRCAYYEVNSNGELSTLNAKKINTWMKYSYTY